MESLYLFYGQEQYLIEEALKKIKKSFNVLMNGINLIKIDENNKGGTQDDSIPKRLLCRRADGGSQPDRHPVSGRPPAGI